MIEPAHWNPGEQIVQYEMWGESIATARPVTVVEDLSRHIALYSHPGVKTVSRGIENRYSLSLSERIDLYIERLDPSVEEFRNKVASNYRVLTLTRPNSWHSVWLFWSSEWKFNTWYVNFPVSNSPCAAWNPASRLCTRHCCATGHVMVLEGRGRVRGIGSPWILHRRARVVNTSRGRPDGQNYRERRTAFL